ncbi:hypothetical protein [Scandinavium sp.]|uniref:hypothetical protein n=1 Tax=Scandinavium sp. TaxID=2830653 RepID=UPI00289C0648|nr:hypothetical protein [Scandinavium sp.]
MSVSDGLLVDLTGNQLFQPGVDGSVSTTIGTRQGINRIVNDRGVLGADVGSIQDNQYINMRIADVTNGTLNVNIGQNNATSSASTNGRTLAAKQSTLFNVDGGRAEKL